MKTQGTELYAIDPVGFTLINVGCFTSLDGIDTSIDQIETTCFTSLARTYEAGLATPGSASFGLNIDTANPAHIRLHQLKIAGTTLQWAVGLSDGPRTDGLGVPPTIEATAGADGVRDFVLPETRSWITFDGYMNSFPFTFGLNDVVKSTVGIQVSGEPALIAAVAA
ncbi:MAG: phage tail tube protein [Janthinobacterium lividum]